MVVDLPANNARAGRPLVYSVTLYRAEHRPMHVKNFLKSSRLHHRDPAVRLEALHTLDSSDTENSEQLSQLALNDPDAAVRVAAIKRLHDVGLLLSLQRAEGDQADQVYDASEARLVTLMSEQPLPENVMQGLLETGSPAGLGLVAINGVDVGQRQCALQQLEDETELLQVVQRSRFHDMRAAAADRLQQPDTLRAALVSCRSRDKEVARHLQARLDERAAIEAQGVANEQAVSNTLAALQSLADSVWSPQTGGRLQALIERWDSLDPALRAAGEAGFAAARERVEAQMKEHRPALAEASSSGSTPDSNESTAELDAQPSEGAASTSTATGVSQPGTNTDGDAQSSVTVGKAGAEPVAEVAKPPRPVAPEATDADYQALKSGLQPLGLKPLAASLARQGKGDESPAKTTAPTESSGPTESIEPATAAAPHATESSAAPTGISLDAMDVHSDAAKRLLSHARAVAVLFDPPYALNKARPGELQQRLKRVQALLEPQVAGPDVQFAELQYAVELEAHRAALVDRVDKARQESADRIKATHRQFAALSGIVSEGKWSPANSLFRRLQKKIAAMEPAERRQIEDKLSRAEKQLAEMADWQDFAARPKLEVLCEQMEVLPARQLDPAALATAVRDYQAQWKAMGVSRASNDLWSRFKTAGDAAYEPCKAFFEQKQVERDQKTANKAAICKRLQKFVEAFDAGAPDWKAVQKETSKAKREWSRNRVSDRKPDRALEKRFSDLLKPLDTAMSGEHEANEALKAQLVERAAKLAEGEINQHATNQARQLQAQWKLVGITRRKQDQALWEQFNGHCRAIFKQQQDTQRAQYQASMGHVFRAREIIKELRALGRGDKADDAAVQTLSSEFHALEAFPVRDKKGLERDFRSALDACSRIQENAARRRRQAGQEEVQRRLALCEQLEAAVENEQLRHATLIDDVQHGWDNSEAEAPREIEQLLAARRDVALEHLDKGTRYDYAAAEVQRRDLLIEMEVAADLDSPAEDKARRMKYQLAKLQEGMSAGAVVDRKARLKELEVQWLALPPAPAMIRDALNSRYLKAIGR